MPQLEVTLPLPPSVNHSHEHAARRSRRTGKVYTKRVPSTELRRWRAAAWCIVREAVTSTRWRKLPATEKAIVELSYFWPDARRRDTHNRIKALMDLLESAGVFSDDRAALARELDFEVDRARPRVEITVKPFDRR